MPITPGRTGSPVDAMVVEEGLAGRVELGAHHDAVVHAEPRRTDHRPVLTAREFLRIDPTGRVRLGGHHPERAGDDDLAGMIARRQLASDPGHPRLGRQHLHAGHLHDLRDGAACRHADAAPGGPVECQPAGVGHRAAQVRRDLAQQIVGGGVVGLAAVAESTGDRREHDRGADRHLTCAVEHVEPSVGLDVEDQVVLARFLVREVPADLETGGVEQHVDVAAALAHDIHHGMRPRRRR
jgi:hypothetical protein